MTKDKSLSASKNVPKSKKKRIYRKRVRKQTINKNKKKFKKSLKERRLLVGGELRCQDIDVKYLKKTPSQILKPSETVDDLKEQEQINFLREIFENHETPSGGEELTMYEQLFPRKLDDKGDSEKEKVCLDDNILEVLLVEYYFLISSESPEGNGKEGQNESFNNFEELSDEQKGEVENQLLSDLKEYCTILISALKLEIELPFEGSVIHSIQNGGGLIGKTFLFFILFFGIINSTMASNFFRNPQMRVAIRKNISSKISNGVKLKELSDALDLIKPPTMSEFNRVKTLSTDNRTKQVTLLAHNLLGTPKFNDLFKTKALEDFYKFKKVGNELIGIKNNVEALRRGELNTLEGITELSIGVTNLIIHSDKLLGLKILTEIKELKGSLEYAYEQSNNGYSVSERTQKGPLKLHVNTIFTSNSPHPMRPNY